MLSDYKKRLTYHHIKKKCDGGKVTIDNGALLNREAHDFLHYQETHDIQLYSDLQHALCLYKQCVELNETDCLIEWQAVQEQIRKRIKVR